MRTLTALMLFATTPVAAGNFEDGNAAGQAGNLQNVFRLLKPSAEQGDARSQFHLGMMYAKGDGIPQDYVHPDA